MAALKLLSFLALVALVALSSGPVHVDALVADRAQVARHAHDAIAKRKRDSSSAPSSSGRCQPRPSSSSVASSVPTYAPIISPSSTPPPTPSATSAAAPSSTSTSSSGQWGLAFNHDPSYLANFASLPNVGYMYNWNSAKPAVDLSQYPNLKYMPMLWGNSATDTAQFAQLVVEGYATIALGANEPNEPSQSNLTPQEGYDLWTQYLQPLSTKGYALASPACTDDQSGIQWYQEFFNLCTLPNCWVDYVAFHAYTTNSQDLINYATMLHANYSKPVMITEFADTSFSGGSQPSMSEVQSFAADVVSFVNANPWVKAFPFGIVPDISGLGVDGNNALVTDTGSPTDLAYTYFG